MTVPNLITLVRVLLTPLLVWLLLEERVGEALLVFVLAGVTDGLDGFIARVFHQKSRLGAYLDPLADKLLLVSSFILLGDLGLMPRWLVVTAVSRDAIIALGVASLVFHHVPLEIKPVLLGKITTVVQIAAVCACLSDASFSWNLSGLTYLYGVTALLTFMSGFNYIYVAMKVWESHRSNTSS